MGAGAGRDKKLLVRLLFDSTRHCRFGFQVSSLNPYNADATFIQRTRTQRFLKTIKTLSCWYSFESSRRVLSYEYPFARVSVIFRVLLHYFVLTKLAFSSIRVKTCHWYPRYMRCYLIMPAVFRKALEVHFDREHL